MADDLSKYGTVGDDDMAKYGEFTAAPSAAQPPTAPGSLIPEPVKRFASNALAAINPLPGLGQIASEATNPNIGLKKTIESHFFQPQADQFHQAASVMRGEGEGAGMGLPGRLSMAGGHALAGALPLVGPAAARAGEQIASGDVAGGLGAGAGLVTSMLAPSVIRGTGRSLSAAAEPIAENAAGIAFRDRAFGRNGELGGMTPGRFALDYTSGVRPGTVTRQAQQSLSDINNRLEGVVGASNADTSLKPARDVVGDRIQRAGERNSKIEPGQLQPMAEYLGGKPTPNFAGATEYSPGAHTPVTFHPPATTAYGAGTPQVTRGVSPEPVVAETQTPANLLGMKRQFSNDFVRNWNPVSETKGQLGVARQATHALGDELHTAVPESKPLDVAASAGIPIAENSEIKALRAGPIQNMMNRFGAHTGALTSAIVGGATHGPAGAALGLAVPELLANPTVQMAGARALDTAGKIAAFNRAKGLAAPSLPLSAPLMVKRQTQ